MDSGIPSVYSPPAADESRRTLYDFPRHDSSRRASSQQLLGERQSIASGISQYTVRPREEYIDSSNNAETAPIRHRSLYYRAVRFSVRLGEWWFPEIASFIIAGALFGLHIYLLKTYDDKPVEEWERTAISSFSVFDTLPSTISFLSTLMRGALGLPVASAIGQWKWHQYRRRAKPLDELDRFDKASRGLTGSIAFLLSGNFWSPASLGCIIIISGLFLGPFLQNTIRTEIRTSPLPSWDNVTMPVADKFNYQHTLGSVEDELHLLTATPFMQSNIARGWSYGFSYEATSNLSSQVFPHCPSNKCQWDNWSSLKLFSRCESAEVNTTQDYPFSEAANVTVMRTFADGNRNRTVLNMVTRDRVGRSSFFYNMVQNSAILAHVGVIVDYDENGTDVEAVECVLYWGVVQANSTWLNGYIMDNTTQNLTWTVTRPDSVPDLDDTPWRFDNITVKTNGTCNFQRRNFSSEDVRGASGAACEFTVTDKAQRGLINSLHPYISGYSFRNRTSKGQSYVHPSDSMNALFMWDWMDERGRVEGPRHEQVLLLTTAQQMRNLAYFVTAALRRQSGSVSIGTASEDVLYFEARYYHLILPGIILATSVVFFALAAVWTRGEKAWRNSQLPLLYHGMEGTGPKEWQKMRMTSMWEAACDAKVKMEHGEDGGLRLRRHRGEMEELREYRGYTRIEETTR